MIKIPLNALSAEALRGVVEAYVLREGTDYGHRDYSLDAKCRAVLLQLEAGAAEIWFDAESGSSDIREAIHSNEK